MRHIKIFHLVNELVQGGVKSEESKTPERPPHWQKMTPLDKKTLGYFKLIKKAIQENMDKNL